VEQSELENRSRNIDLLRKNLNLLQEEFKTQANRSRRKYGQSTASMHGGVQNDEFGGDLIDIFKNDKKKKKDIENGGETGINASIVEEDSEQELNQDELSILKQFEEND
jgi:hypothetical protein